MSSEPPCVAVAPVLLEPSDSFAAVNIFSASGKYVLVAFWRSFLKLEMTGPEETRSKLTTSSFVDNEDVFLE
jgi:hypothetical protein